MPQEDESVVGAALRSPKCNPETLLNTQHRRSNMATAPFITAPVIHRPLRLGHDLPQLDPALQERQGLDRGHLLMDISRTLARMEEKLPYCRPRHLGR